MTKTIWVKIQWWVGEKLFNLGIVQSIKWDIRWKNKVFYNLNDL